MSNETTNNPIAHHIIIPSILQILRLVGMHENRQEEQEGEEKMKIEEAIEYMKDGVNGIHNECDTMLNNNSEIDDAFELIKEACEKQIAKKLDIQGNQAGVYETCSECNWLIIDSEEKPNYCKECGQKLDWGKE